ncbi:insulinase family protein [Draconibacterium sp. IB214405]|uniref:M16 family metallopeptidase n=1 Tax=Draconibacterium sp. IB214405 TaxID=3097352 RepID=UPI002A130A28|nr:insulinase family protein [Draconibacterium sp. IB214405]MDX8340283.1 insulinase family protein [Draconibacterium sp. IB214405]
MNKFFLILSGLILLSLNLFAQQFSDLSRPIPFDPEIRSGVLPNGLTYYIKHNEVPEKRASFYIYQNVGAILETDEQDGLAHFLEHMAFNGTETFPAKTMLDMLERNGVKFGKDINAYTTTDETVYNISKVPTAVDGLVDSCLIILRDWCDGLALTEEELDAERGVITEEWRTRRNSGFRVNAQLAPTVYNGSRYAERDVIGELDVIKNFDPKEIRSFYHDWYRTDLQAIAIVGDIDVDAIEKQVIELFSPIAAIENPVSRNSADTIPDNDEAMYAVATDRDVKNVTVSLNVRHKYQTDGTMAQLRETYILSIFNSLMRQRFSELTQSADAPFLGAKVQVASLLRDYKIFKVSATARVGEEATAFEEVYSVFQQVLNDGFTESELERTKLNLIAGAENNYNKRDQVSSDGYGKALKNVYLKGSSLPESSFNYQFVKEVVPGITLEEVSAVASKYLGDKNRYYTVVGPSNAEVDFITQEEIEEIISTVESSDLAAYNDHTPVNAELLPVKPQPGKIVNEKELKEFDAVEWTLSNGAKVIYRFADFQKNSVRLTAQSYGGTSIYEVEDLPSAVAVNSFVKTFGIGELDPISYKKVMAGKTASSSFKVGPYIDVVAGSSTPADLETMLQLVYMRFEEPRFDEEKFDNQMARNYKTLENKVKSVGEIVKDTLNSILVNGNPRALDFNKYYLDQMSFERMEQIYRERFSNASDFYFFIVGDIDAETLKPLVEEYIGSISSTGEKEKWVDHGHYFPKGNNTYRIGIPTHNKSSVYMKMNAKAKYSRENVIYHSILKSVLDLRFMENIREKEGGTYGVGVKSSASTIPQSRLGMEIRFDCDPTKAEYLRSLVLAELDEVQKNVRQSDLDKVVLNMKKNAEHQNEKNSYWLNVLQTYYDTGENMLDPEYYDAILDRVTTKDIEKAARSFLKSADIVDIIFEPQRFQDQM